MSFSGEDQLNRAWWIGEQPHQPLGIVQEKIGAFIRGKATRKSEGQYLFIENAGSIRRIRAFRGELALVPLAHLLDQAFSSCRAQLPQPLIGDLADVIFGRTIPTPTLHAAGRGPQRIGFCRIPGGHMNAVGYGPYRDLLLRPAGKQRLERCV